MPKTEKNKTSIRPRLRIVAGKNIALGPGKADLLEALAKTGSITKAAAQMGMSYMRAWTLIRTMNESFHEPLVDAVRGGMQGGGGACLTKTGRDVLAGVIVGWKINPLSLSRPTGGNFKDCCGIESTGSRAARIS